VKVTKKEAPEAGALALISIFSSIEDRGLLIANVDLFWDELVRAIRGLTVFLL
jgi:hypothetical protein